MSIEPKKWILTFDVNYNETKSLWNKGTSPNCMLGTAQKTLYIVSAIFLAAFETVVNTLLLIANGSIHVLNGIHSYFAERSVEAVPPRENQPVEAEPPVQQQVLIEPEPATVVEEPVQPPIQQPAPIQQPVLVIVSPQIVASRFEKWIANPLKNWVIQPANTRVWQPICNLIDTYQG